MDPRQFYDEKDVTKRNLSEGSDLRNCHNFIKAVLIKRHVPTRSRILDLGCGQGGDLLKLKHTNPSRYVGMDISHTAISSAQERAACIGMNCLCHFICLDFTDPDWKGYPPYDVINSQFAIHFAFATPQKANSTIERISRSLSENGMFIGTIPQHPGKTGDEVCVTLPDDSRSCREFVVHEADFTELCIKHNLHLVLFQSFSTFVKDAYVSEETLARKMRAKGHPDPRNAVFVFQKRSFLPESTTEFKAK